MKYVHQRGFTIVELLIVIVVIAILAAITLVTYNGIVNRASDSSLQSELDQFSKAAKLETVIQPIPYYPETTALNWLNKNVKPGAKSSYRGERYSLIAVPVAKYESSSNSSVITDFEFAAVSRSSNVFMATPDTKAQSVADWAALVTAYQQDYNYWQNVVNTHPTNSGGASLAEVQSYRDDALRRLQSAQSHQGTKAGLWDMTGLTESNGWIDASGALTPVTPGCQATAFAYDTTVLAWKPMILGQPC